MLTEVKEVMQDW